LQLVNNWWKPARDGQHGKATHLGWHLGGPGSGIPRIGLACPCVHALASGCHHGYTQPFCRFGDFSTKHQLVEGGTLLGNGISVSDNPAKFFLSIGVLMATLAWGLTFLPPEEQQVNRIRSATWIFIAAASFEIL
jgi:hypothetical protein